MNSRSLIGMVIVGLLGLAGGAAMAPAMSGHLGQTSGETCSREQEAANKKIVTSLPPFATYSLIDPAYVQHNPAYMRFGELNGMTPREVVRYVEENRIPMGRPIDPPPPDPNRPEDNWNYAVLAECDMVVLVGEHWFPQPDDPDKYYALYFFNMWRMKDGKLVEHWDPDDMPNPLPENLRLPISERPTAPPVKPLGAPGTGAESTAS